MTRLLLLLALAAAVCMASAGVGAADEVDDDCDADYTRIPAADNASVGDTSNKNTVKLTPSEEECNPSPNKSGDKHAITPDVETVPVAPQSTKQLLFIHDDRSKASITNTDWDGYSDLAAMLEEMSFTVVEQNVNPITLDDLACYDVVVFSPSWRSREISSSEAEALASFVQDGGGLFLMGEHGVASWSDEWDNSVNMVGSYFGIELDFAMVCDPTDHYDRESDPDGGVDLPFITDIKPHEVTDGISKFMINWGTSLQITSPAAAIAYTDSDAWLDINSAWNSDLKKWECYQDTFEAVGRFPVLALSQYGCGKVVAIGDKSLFVNTWLDNYDHYDLAQNIFEWLSVGDADTTPPILTITSPADGTTVTTPSITVTGTASDASGIASVTVNGALASGALDWSTWSAEVTLAEGENTITVVATDAAGNVATQSIVVNYAGNITVDFEGHFGGVTGAVAVSGDYAYIGQGQDLVVLDVSSPASPVELGRVMTSCMVCGVAVSGDYAYVADHYNLVIVDVSNKAAPTLAGSYDTAGDAYRVAVSGDYAYVADRMNGLVIVDVSDKSAPTLAGSYDTAGRARDVAVSGDYAYIADYGKGLVIVDVSDPTAPALTGSYDTAGDALGVAVSGNYAYVANWDNGLVIVDVSDKEAPVLAGSYETTGWAFGVAVSGDYAYVADSDNGLVIVDISSKAAPLPVGRSGTVWAFGVAVSGNYAYVADWDNGLVIVDVSSKSAPALAGSHDTAGDALGVAVSGNYAYVADWDNGLVIVDVSSKSAPVLAGSYDTAGSACDVAVSGDYAYVADWNNGLVIVDVSSKSAPVLAGSYGTGYTRDVAVSGNYAYIGQGQDLVIVDITDKSAPVLAGSYSTGWVYGVAVAGDYAYVANDDNGLVIVDVSSKSAPALAGSHDTAGDAYGVAVSGDYAYVADGDNGLVIVDITDKKAPTLAGSYNTAGIAEGVAVSGDYAYVADENNGLVIVDVSSKLVPALAGSYDTIEAEGVAVSGDYVYVADRNNGLVILRTDASGADTPTPILTITSPADGTTVTTPSITVTGTASDASGIASVTVNSALASGALDWSTWSAEVTLAEGENTITVVATDNAGLTTTRTRHVFLEEVSGEMVKGIDVSHHQGDIVWSEVYNSGCRFAFVKASEGDADPPQIIDDHFEINMEEGYAAGVLMGAYHFAHPQYNDAVDEAQFFVSVAGEYFKGGYIRPVLDLEEGAELGKEALSNWIHEFMSTVEIETGVEPILYVSSNYASNSNLDDSVTKYDLWIAHWTYNPDAHPDTGIWDSWNFWQYSNESSVSGIGGYVDGDLFNGDISTLNTFVIAGLPTSCAIELREQGTTSTIDEIDVGHSFDICVDDSTGDIKEVRFSSDESQDGNPTGTWTSWYDWDTSSGDWNAETKIKTWSFATGGDKEVWAEIKDGSGDVSQCNASIFAHPGYAIIVAGNARQGLIHVLEPWMINYCADTSYSALRNLGFDDEHIFYLTDLSDEDAKVDAPATLSHFKNAINEVKGKIGDDSTPFILYLVGHGVPMGFIFDEEEGSYLWGDELQRQLDEFSSETPMLIVIGSCYSGGFINSPDYSISAPNRIIITAAHDDQEPPFVMWINCGDRFWENLNNGLNVKKAFIEYAGVIDYYYLWLDDNGDKKGHPPDNLEDDGTNASATTIGVPGTDDLEVIIWHWSRIHSPGELRVYDSQDRVTGLVNGEVKEEIPYSVYDEQDKIVAIFTPSDLYRYEIAGTDNGTYGLEVASVEGGESDTFVVTNVSTTNETTHQYDINWSTLSQGVNMSIDADGDGIFEQNITIRLPVTSFTYTPENPIVNQAMTFDATTSYDPDGNITSYDWNFGDGNTTNTTEKTITHSYTSVGDYNVILTVTDDDGVMNSTSKQITIKPLRGDLNGDDTLTPADAVIALQIVVGGSASCDPATLTAADVSGDGKVTSLDALMILQVAAGAIDL